MFRKNDVLCVVCSAGGHLTEALLAIQDVDHEHYIITYKLPHLKGTLANLEHYYIMNPHRNPFKYVINTVQSLLLFLIKKPRYILSTGSGVAIATCLLGKFFGSRVIFIESGARIHTMSLTGRLMYYFSDLFIVQWTSLQKQFPKSVYGGVLL